jgi:hypothetical protein
MQIPRSFQSKGKAAESGIIKVLWAGCHSGAPASSLSQHGFDKSIIYGLESLKCLTAIMEKF